MAAVAESFFVRRPAADGPVLQPHGAAGIDPVVLFTMALLGWRSGITSRRRLAEEVWLTLAFLWLVGSDLDERPLDHAVLSKARTRFGVMVYQAFFTEIVRQCKPAGHIRGDRLSLDSALPAATASLDLMGARTLVARVAGVDDHVAALWRESSSLLIEAPPPAPPRESWTRSTWITTASRSARRSRSRSLMRM
jgi:hypothetical protein